jgi:hypothetical protein
LKTLRVCLNLKLSRNSWMRSMHIEAASGRRYWEGIFLVLGGVDVHIGIPLWNCRYCIRVRWSECLELYIIDVGLQLRLQIFENTWTLSLLVGFFLQLLNSFHTIIIYR